MCPSIHHPCSVNNFKTLRLRDRLAEVDKRGMLACLTYKLLTTCQPAYLHTLLHHYIPTHTLQDYNIVLFITENQYKKNSVPNCMSDAPEIGTGFWRQFLLCVSLS